jgi:hypothetical protein
LVSRIGEGVAAVEVSVTPTSRSAMSLSLAIVLNVFLCLSLLTGLARVMALASRLTPHVPAERASTTVPAPAPVAVTVAEALSDLATPLAAVRDTTEIATAA